MATLSSRVRWGTAVAVAFAGGLLFASGMDWTHHGFAQGMPSAADVQPLTDASNAFVSIADHATPAVVSIQVDSRTRQQPRSAHPPIPRGMLPPGMEQFFDFGQPQRPPVEEGSGSGFIVTKDGYILTNNHVITGPDRQTVADQITVKLMDGRTFPAKVIGHDPLTDVAVIKIDGNNFPTIPLGDDSKSRVGEWVLAIGNPLGVLDFTVTAGIISAKGRSLQGLYNDRYAISDLIQTDAAINPGNSGGPLVNTRGEVIGINNAIASESGYYQGYGFAVPISLAKKVMDDLIAHGSVRFGVLGVQVGEVDADAAAVAKLPKVAGALVSGFNPDDASNPARKAGMQEGDVIVAIDGQPVDRVSTLQRIVRFHDPGETLKVEAIRYGKRMTFDVKLAPRPSDKQTVSASSGPASPTSVTGAKLGVALEAVPTSAQRQQMNLPDAFPAHGAVVASTVPLGPSYGKLQQGDVVTEVLYPAPRRPINSPADLQNVLNGMKTGDYISLNVATPDGQGGFATRIVNIRLGS